MMADLPPATAKVNPEGSAAATTLDYKPEHTPAVTEPAVTESTVTKPTVIEPTVTEPTVNDPIAPAAEDRHITETLASPVAAEEKKETATKEVDVKPIEAGTLEHKGSNFPENFIFSKKYFWFGSEPVDTRVSSTFKADKVADVAHHVAAWASHTGHGLLFYSKKSDKSAPHGAIQLAETSEPTTEGLNKFYFTSKGHKHTFKVATGAERDNWVRQLKLKIGEAKELATTVPESDNYKRTLASYKPTPTARKEEKLATAPTTMTTSATAEEHVKEEPAQATETSAISAAATGVAATGPATIGEEPVKKRSSSRKRNSIFGSLLGKKDEDKKITEPHTVETKHAETKTHEAPLATEALTETTPLTPVAAAPTVEPVSETSGVEVAPLAETSTPIETKDKETKPNPSKRGSIFGSLLSKRTRSPEPTTEPFTAPAAEITPAATETTTTEPTITSETAPVIPPVETTAPLSAEIGSPATVPTETIDITPTTHGEAAKKDAREKRKSSLPFAFGKKDKSPSSDEEGEKAKSPSAFSKLRATIKNKTKPTAATEKAELKATEAETAAVTTVAPTSSTTEVAKPTEPESVTGPIAVDEITHHEKPISAPVIPAAA